MLVFVSVLVTRTNNTKHPLLHVADSRFTTRERQIRQRHNVILPPLLCSRTKVDSGDGRLLIQFPEQRNLDGYQVSNTRWRNFFLHAKIPHVQCVAQLCTAHALGRHGGQNKYRHLIQHYCMISFFGLLYDAAVHVYTSYHHLTALPFPAPL